MSAAAISALSLFHRKKEEEEEEWADSNLSSLSLSNGNANVHPSGSSGQWGRACVRRGEGGRGSGYFTEKGRQIGEGGIQTGRPNRI